MSRHVSRSGTTLIELLVLIAATSVILSLATAAFVTLFRSERQIRDDTAQAQTLARLSSRWRADVHAAVSAKVDKACELTWPDGRTVHYAFEAPRISREVRRGQKVEHRDSFTLPSRSQAQFSQAAEATWTVVRLSIRPAVLPDKAYATPPRPATIDAALNPHGQTPLEAAP
jgi:Tfp pilus assembly protein FimT